MDDRWWVRGGGRWAVDGGTVVGGQVVTAMSALAFAGTGHFAILNDRTGRSWYDHHLFTRVSKQSLAEFS